MEITSLPGEAVCLATGGPGIIFGKSTNSVVGAARGGGLSRRARKLHAAAYDEATRAKWAERIRVVYKSGMQD